MVRKNGLLGKITIETHLAALSEIKTRFCVRKRTHFTGLKWKKRTYTEKSFVPGVPSPIGPRSKRTE